MAWQLRKSLPLILSFEGIKQAALMGGNAALKILPFVRKAFLLLLLGQVQQEDGVCSPGPEPDVPSCSKVEHGEGEIRAELGRPCGQMSFVHWGVSSFWVPSSDWLPPHCVFYGPETSSPAAHRPDEDFLGLSGVVWKRAHL